MATITTQKEIDLIAPTDRLQEFADSKQKGLRIRVYPSGVKSYIARLRATDGKTRVMTLGSVADLSLEKARHKVSELRMERKEVGDPILARRQASEAALTAARATESAKKADGFTFRDLTDRFLAEHKLGAYTARDYRQALEKTFAPLANIPAAKVTDDMIDQIVAKKAKAHGTTARRALAAVSSCFAWAKRRKLVTSNPAIGVERPAKGLPRERTLSPAEIKALLAGLKTINPEFARPIEIMLRTGQRAGEVFGMTHEEVDGDLWTIPASRYKTGKPHRVPLAPQAAEIIGKGEGYVFPRKRRDGASGHVRADSAIKLFQQILADAEIKPATLHDLRRTFESRCVDTLRLDGDVVHHDCTGHVRAGLKATYQHLERLPDVRNVMEVWNDWLDALAADNVTPIKRTA